MTQRLVLSTVGIKSPLDIGSDVMPPELELPPRSSSAARKPRQSCPTDRSQAQPLLVAAVDQVPRIAPFYATGRPRQTSIALDPQFVQGLDDVARAAGVSVNALAVAALHAGLPATTENARTRVLEERLIRLDAGRRMESNLRLPDHLRTRVDELAAAVRGRIPRATRADLVNAALRSHLPADAERAAELVRGHTRRLEEVEAA